MTNEFIEAENLNLIFFHCLCCFKFCTFFMDKKRASPFVSSLFCWFSCISTVLQYLQNRWMFKFKCWGHIGIVMVCFFKPSFFPSQQRCRPHLTSDLNKMFQLKPSKQSWKHPFKHIWNICFYKTYIFWLKQPYCPV